MMPKSKTRRKDSVLEFMMQFIDISVVERQAIGFCAEVVEADGLLSQGGFNVPQFSLRTPTPPTSGLRRPPELVDLSRLSTKIGPLAPPSMLIRALTLATEDRMSLNLEGIAQSGSFDLDSDL
jgi:hypothetical protein